MIKCTVKDGIVMSMIEDQGIILDTASEQIFYLNSTAAAIFDIVQRGVSTPSGVAHDLSLQYDVLIPDCLQDVEDLMTELIENKIFVIDETLNDRDYGRDDTKINSLVLRSAYEKPMLLVLDEALALMAPFNRSWCYASSSK